MTTSGRSRAGKGSGSATSAGPRAQARASRRDRRQAARDEPGAPAPKPAGWITRVDLLGILLLVAACALVYANGIGNQFVWDDQKQILENGLIKDPSLIGRAMVSDVWAFKGDTGEPWSNYWRPVFILWLIGNYRAFGIASTTGWHVANIALHAGVVSLAYLFLRRLGVSRLLALAIGLPFAVHPIHVESVTWISGSPDLQVAAGLLGALILLLVGLDRKNPTGLAGLLALGLSLVAFSLSLLSKEITIFFPAIIFVTVLLAGPRKPSLVSRARAAVLWTLPFVVLTGIYAIAHYKILGKAQIEVAWKVGPSGVFFSAPRVLFFYLREAFFPLWIAPAYPVRVLTAPDAANFLLPGLVVAVVLGGLVWLARRDAVRGIGLALFLVPLLPALNIGAFAPDRVVADRYLYLPSLGLLMILVPSVAELVGFLRARRAAGATARRPAQAGGAGVEVVTFWIFASVALLLGLQTIRYNRIWETELSLWSAAIASDPNSVSALNEYALQMYQAKRLTEARAALDHALSIEPLTTAYLLRADVSTAEKRYADAESDIKQVLGVYADYAGAYERLALVYQNQNRLGEAESTLRTAIVKAPHRRGAFTDSLGIVLYLQGRRAEALQTLEAGRPLATTELNPGAEAILFHLGSLYAEMGRAREARAALEEYLRVSEGSTDKDTRERRKQTLDALAGLPR